jgi:hypothetical protein
VTRGAFRANYHKRLAAIEAPFDRIERA